MRQGALRLLVCLTMTAAVTLVASKLAPVNATTAGFGYLLLVLIIASTWGFFEAALTSLSATLAFNFFFLPPVGTFTIADPQNWVALFTFLASSLIAGRLSTEAKRRTLDAVERQQDLERLYTFSRAILLIGREEPFPSQLIRKLVETFQLSAAVLLDGRTGEVYRSGSGPVDGLEEQLRNVALHGASFSDPGAKRTVIAVRLGSEPIANLALQGTEMPDSVLQGVANLVAIGLERARVQHLEHEIEAVQQSEQLRTTLIDAMAHEFKTPLTLIKGATTSILAASGDLSETTREQLTIADEEAEHLRELLDNAIEMARLDTARIEVHPELSDLTKMVQEVVAAMHPEIDGRPLEIIMDEMAPVIPIDRRLVKLALKQLIDNAIKYSPPDSSVAILIQRHQETAAVQITNQGPGISSEDQKRVFERFYRGQSVRNQIPGSGLGLTIASSILRAHGGALSLSSRPGETTLRMTLPLSRSGGANP